MAVSGQRKVSSVLYQNRKRVKIFDMEVEDDDDDDDDDEYDTLGTSGLSSDMNTSN